MGFLGDLISDVTEPIGGLFKDVGSGVSSVISPITSAAGNVLNKGLNVGEDFLQAPFKLLSNPIVLIGGGILLVTVLPILLKR